MEETSWVRTTYLYVMTAVAIAVMAVGAVGTVLGLVHTIAPDLGHRDTLDRVGIGVSNIAGDIIDLLDENQREDVEAFCEDVTDDDDDFDECVDDQMTSGSEMDSITDGIGKVKSELQGQIRNNSVDQMLRGLFAITIGFVLFRIHGRRTQLFADGLFPRPTPTASGDSGIGVAASTAANGFPPPPTPQAEVTPEG